MYFADIGYNDAEFRPDVFYTGPMWQVSPRVPKTGIRSS